MFIWQRKGWPHFGWRAESLLEPLAAARYAQGALLSRLRGLGFGLRLEAQAQALTEEAIKTSAIEGEVVDPSSVRSSLARRLGLPSAGAQDPVDRRAEGLVELMLDATAGHAQPLTKARLFGWHAALFPTGYSGLHRVKAGTWRDDAQGPMQVVSGPMDRSKVHYEAPPARQLAGEMRRFLAWFNRAPEGDGLLRAGLAHLWFVTLHPFDDGNGRLARAITDMALAQLEASPQRFYSVSSQILRNRSAYYAILERTQRGGLDVTDWLSWFLICYQRAIAAAESACAEVLQRARFWDKYAQEPLTPRQKEVLNRVLEPFEGVLTAKKWAALAKTSVDTAQRDINDLVARGLLVKNPGGSKRTSYSLAL